MSFHEVLSALNPLQYLPLVGTIYRSVTGDQIPDAMRRIGSLIASTLIGGPIGFVTNMAMTMAEKISGIDLDRVGQALLTGNGGAGPPTASAPAANAAATATAATTPGANPTATVTTAATTVAAPPAGNQPSANPAPAPVAHVAAAQPTGVSADQPWSPAQLAAYGVASSGDGTFKMVDLKGADVLNALELTRIHDAQVAYGKAQGQASL